MKTESEQARELANTLSYAGWPTIAAKVRLLADRAPALRELLEALSGPGHLIRELQMLRGPLVEKDNPINILVAEFNASVEMPSCEQEAEGDSWPKLERPAALHADGSASFGKGVSSKLLVEAAYRLQDRTAEVRARTPAERNAAEVQRRAAWDLFHGAPVLAIAAPVLPLQRYRDDREAMMFDDAGEWVRFADVQAIAARQIQTARATTKGIDTRQLRNILAAVQDGEVTVSRAIECIEALEYGHYADNWLPPCQGYFGEDEMPIEVVRALRAAAENKPKRVAAGWLTSDGRIATSYTKDSSMPEASRVNFNIPLYKDEGT